jgi:hypothetical protein
MTSMATRSSWSTPPVFPWPALSARPELSNATRDG